MPLKIEVVSYLDVISESVRSIGAANTVLIKDGLLWGYNTDYIGVYDYFKDKNLKFFEKHFKGVLPFEIVVDTQKPDGVFADDAKTLYKIKSLQKMLLIF
jgi:hypothetical protein